MELKEVMQLVSEALNILGIILIFKFGISPYLLNNSDGFLMLNKEEAINDKDSEMNRAKRRYTILATIGLWSCIAGGLIRIFYVFCN
jgi:hypothetical protein